MSIGRTMYTLGEAEIYNILKIVGFDQHLTFKRMFLKAGGFDIGKALILHTNRRGGGVRLGGAIGLYFAEFEEMWEKSLSRENQKLNKSLPVSMLIDNFVLQVDEEVFRFQTTQGGVRLQAAAIRDLCSELPGSVDEFADRLAQGVMLGHAVSSYFNIAEHLDDDDLCQCKGISFALWFIRKWPGYERSLFSCLNEFQTSKIAQAACLN